MGTGAISIHFKGLVDAILPGSESRANAHWGSLGTWEIPSISAPIAGRDNPADQVPGSWRGPLAGLMKRVLCHLTQLVPFLFQFLRSHKGFPSLGLNRFAKRVFAPSHHLLGANPL